MARDIIVSETQLIHNCMDTVVSTTDNRIILCMEGTAIVQINMSEYSFRRGDGVILPKDTAVHFVEYSGNLSVSALAGIVIPVADAQVFRLGRDEFEVARSILELLWRYSDISGEDPVFIGHQVESLTSFLSSHATAGPDTSTGGRKMELLKEFIRLVQADSREHKDVEYYARRMNVTQSYLYSNVTRAVGRSPMDVIGRLVCQKAEVLLSQKGALISDVADQLGFSSPSNFAKYFKRITSFTPREYQQMVKCQ